MRFEDAVRGMCDLGYRTSEAEQAMARLVQEMAKKWLEDRQEQARKAELARAQLLDIKKGLE